MTTAARKMAACLSLARLCSRATWQMPTQYRAEYRRIVRESMDDARYWRDQLEAAK